METTLKRERANFVEMDEREKLIKSCGDRCG
jgi:hypothetical protein